eukprot:gb/GECG01015528.1/.p1 GENE.gb/GECG01015528.1/~~gb/GECG01015528.1/.p1  ORF type:complete len:750 (+),score=71.23 gb/GECG01015528.1/:1-2250(+)
MPRLAMKVGMVQYATVLLSCALLSTLLLFFESSATPPGSSTIVDQVGSSKIQGDCGLDHSGVLNVWVVYGTRPELIKLAPVVWALQKERGVRICVINTGQHGSLTDTLASHFRITDDVRFILNRSTSLNALFVNVHRSLAQLLVGHGRTTFVVQGDTTTAAAAGWASFLHGDSHLIHVESGLRTGSLRSPYPEELNRRILGQMCTLCFAPTVTSLSNLQEEHIDRGRLFLVGNTVIDALYYTLSNVASKELQLRDMETGADLAFTRKALMSKRRVVLVTTHRRERIGEPMQVLFKVIRDAALKYTDSVFFLPLHPNPEVRAAMGDKRLLDIPNIVLIMPPAYPDFVILLSMASIVVSDSGGIQEEASSLGIPLLITRKYSERMEAVDNGNAILVGDKAEKLQSTLSQLLENDHIFTSMAKKTNAFGNGNSANALVSIMMRHKDTLLQPPEVKRDFTDKIRTNMHFGDSAPNTQFSVNRSDGDITVIVQVFRKSPELLDMQLQALLSSSKRPKEIIVVQNENRADFKKVLLKYPHVKHIHSVNKNLRFHGRFLLPLMAETEFCAVVDDDAIPGSGYLEYAVDNVRELHGLIGSSARIVAESDFSRYCAHKLVGNQQICDYPNVNWDAVGADHLEVDFVGHWWVFRTEWAYTMWRVPSPTFDTGEDISFAAILFLLDNIRSYVLRPRTRAEIPEIGIPSRLKASTRGAQTTHAAERKQRIRLINYWREQGWIPVLSRRKRRVEQNKNLTPP